MDRPGSGPYSSRCFIHNNKKGFPMPRRLPVVLALTVFLLPFSMFTQVVFAQAAPAAGYRNFEASLYVRAAEVAQMQDAAWMESNYEAVAGKLKLGKIYLETHRDRQIVDEATLEQAIAFFRGKGLTVAGGITLTISEPNRFETFCYSDPVDRQWVQHLAEYTAAHFDEFILDDFFFTSCKNDIEIDAKGDQSWTDYRLALLRDAAEQLIIGPAKAVNPDVKVIVKYPNWYEHFQGLGFNLESGPFQFDGIYSGTETRDAVRSAQHLQAYHSYQIFRYFDNLKPGHNGGGWVDTGGAGSIDRYVEQLWGTLFAKAPELTLFELRQIQNPVTERLRGAWQDQDTSFDFAAMQQQAAGVDPTFALAAGIAMQQVDDILPLLGNPIGVQSYRPTHATGEDFLHNYLGMAGIPIDLHPRFPEQAGTVLLTQSAAFDEAIVDKIEAHVRSGRNVVITSGLLEALEPRGIGRIAELQFTSRKALVQEFQARAFGPIVSTAEPVLIPQIQYLTNDSWELVSALAGSNGWPLLHDADYNGGHLYVLTIPDNFSDLYRLPTPVLTAIRQTLSQDLPVYLEAPGQVSLFVYDNDTVIVESFLDQASEFALITGTEVQSITDLQNNETPAATLVAASGGFGSPRIEEQKRFAFTLPPHSWRVLKLE
jgi:hypothetical protein